MRISNFGIKNDFVNQLHKNAASLNKVERQLGTGQRYERTSDNPIAGINSVYYKTKLSQLSQYKKNVEDAKGYVKTSHDYALHSVNVLQKIRELTVQAANGIYSKEERGNMAMEVEELLKEIVNTANSKYKDEYLFSGSKVSTKPFLSFMTSKPGFSKPFTEQVTYVGDERETVREIDQKERVSIGLSGNTLFWGEDNIIISLKDSGGYLANSDQEISIDGQIVRVQEGDDLDTVIDKINRNVPSVTAEKRELPDGKIVFSVESNYPHQLSIADIKGGSVMSDLGIIHSGAQGYSPPNNIQPNTMQRGGSLFDVIINLRNALLDDNVSDIGGRHLGALDRSLNNMLRAGARISASQNRMNDVEKKLAVDETNTLEQLSKTQDMDIAEASLNFNQLANVHRISLMTASKIIRPTLMDYL